MGGKATSQRKKHKTRNMLGNRGGEENSNVCVVRWVGGKLKVN